MAPSQNISPIQHGDLTINQTYQLIQSWKMQTPHIISFYTIGQTHLNHSIRIFGLTKIKNKQIQYLKKYPAVLINSLIHSRQKGSLKLLLATFLYLEDISKTNQLIDFMLQNTIIWFLPYFNLDSVLEMEKIWQNYKLLDQNVQYRKNKNYKRQVQCSRQIDKGVDLNRNFDIMWQNYKNKMDPCDQQYPGQYPFSQNQTKTIKKFYQQWNIIMALDFHSYGNKWIYPYTYDQTQKQLKKNIIHHRFYSQIIKQLNNINASIDTCISALGYITSFGVYIDWALSKGTFSFVYEVGSSFFNDRSLINDIKISLKEIQLVLIRNSFNFKIVNVELGDENDILQIQSLSTRELEIQIQQLLYWKRGDVKDENKSILVKPFERIIICVIKMKEQKLIIKIKSESGKQFKQSIDLPKYSKIINLTNFCILSGILLIAFCLIKKNPNIKQTQYQYQQQHNLITV